MLIRPDQLFEGAVIARPEPIEKARGLDIIVSLHDKTIARGQSSRPQMSPGRGPGLPVRVLDFRPMTKREQGGGEGPARRPAAEHAPASWPRHRDPGGEGRRLKRVPGLALAALLALTCGLTQAHAQPAGELRVALPWTPENLDPTMNLASIGRPSA